MNADNAFEMTINPYITIKCTFSSILHLTIDTNVLKSHHELSDLFFAHSASCISRYRKLGLLSSLERPAANQKSMLPDLPRTSMARFCYVQMLHVACGLGWNLGTCGLDLVSTYHISAVHRQDSNTVQDRKTMGHHRGLQASLRCTPS